MTSKQIKQAVVVLVFMCGAAALAGGLFLTVGVARLIQSRRSR